MVAISVLQPETAEWSPAPRGTPAPRSRGPAPQPRVARRRSRPSLDRATRYRRRRLAALVVLVLAVTSGAATVQAVSSLLPSGGGRSAGQPEPLAGVDGGVYVVQPGDTLWTIASALAPEADPRSVVDELRRANGGSALEVGDRLRVDLG